MYSNGKQKDIVWTDSKRRSNNKTGAQDRIIR